MERRRYRQPLDLRAYVLAHMLLQRLRERHGPTWFEEKAVGAHLVKVLCTPGSSPGPRALMKRLSFEALDHDAPGRSFAQAERATRDR